MSSECSSDETVIYVVKSNAGDTEKNTDEDDIDDEEDHEEHNEPEKALPKIYSAVNSVSSQDSGINLSFHESEKSGESPEIGRSSSAESNSNGYTRRPRLTINTGINFSKQVRNDDLSEDEEAFLLSESSGQEGEEDLKTENGINTIQSLWHCPPKNVWKPVVAAMQEFEMIKDNDRVLVCLSLGGRNSLALVHTLHQYRFYVRSKGIDFGIGVAAVDDSRHDPLESMSYLKALDVPYFYEEVSSNTSHEEDDDSVLKTLDNGPCSFCDRSTRGRLYSVAKKHNYNVLALGQNLDDLTEGFLASVFHSGKLRTMRAHYNIREQDLRVIRPFVYVSDKALRQFFENKKLPLFREASNEETLQVFETNFYLQKPFFLNNFD